MKNIIIVIYLVISFMSCKKSGINPPSAPKTKTYSDFLRNTEWVGVDDGHRSQYPRPTDLKFQSDSTITIYSIFKLSKDGGITLIDTDSINGKIIKIDSLTDGSTHIVANFPDLDGDQFVSITNRKELSMSIADANHPSFNSRTFNLALFPSDGVSLSSTSWSGQQINPDDLPSSYYFCPDLSTVTFSAINGDEQVTYTKNGHIVQQQVGDALEILRVSFQQIGARVYFFGYNDDYSWDMDIALRTGNYTDYKQGRMMKYFGVLLPSGDKMFVDSRSANARLPNYTQTSDRYGLAGVTPVITKH